jgi:hypothetical protein
LSVNGVKGVESNWFVHWIKVTYDDEVATVDAMIKALDKEGFYIEGQPEFLQ